MFDTALDTKCLGSNGEPICFFEFLNEELYLGCDILLKAFLPNSEHSQNCGAKPP